jgi:hypothetical protein
MSSSVQLASATLRSPECSAYEPWHRARTESRTIMQTATQTFGLLKAVLWIAGGAFATGFLGYIAIGMNSLPG